MDKNCCFSLIALFQNKIKLFSLKYYCKVFIDRLTSIFNHAAFQYRPCRYPINRNEDECFSNAVSRADSFVLLLLFFVSKMNDSPLLAKKFNRKGRGRERASNFRNILYYDNLCLWKKYNLFLFKRRVTIFSNEKAKIYPPEFLKFPCVRIVHRENKIKRSRKAMQIFVRGCRGNDTKEKKKRKKRERKREKGRS